MKKYVWAVKRPYVTDQVGFWYLGRFVPRELQVGFWYLGRFVPRELPNVKNMGKGSKARQWIRLRLPSCNPQAHTICFWSEHFLKGKYHLIVDPLFFAWIQRLCLCWMNNSFTCSVKSKPVIQSNRRSVVQWYFSLWSVLFAFWSLFHLCFFVNQLRKEKANTTEIDRLGIVGPNLSCSTTCTTKLAVNRRVVETKLCRGVLVRTVWPDWLFLKKLSYTFSFNNSPNIWQLFGLVRKMALFNQNCCGYFLGHFWIKLGYFLLQHLVTLILYVAD